LTTRYRLQIPRNLYEAMLTDALAQLPNECCGLLAGAVVDGVGVVSRRFPLVNIAPSPRIEYLSEPRSMLAAEKAMSAAGLDRLAAYHSHPTSDPIPSRKDRERNYAGVALNLIISLKGGQPSARVWWLVNSESFEGEWEITDCAGGG
jgi:[CysO sulfur-carrier protein]-S-L-cysteine hydrolase